MFENVLIAEDHESVNISLRRTLEDLKISHVDYAYYCDQALSKVKKALQVAKPYDLLITDLYFEIDGTSEQLFDGPELIKEAKGLQSQLKILVFSAESRPSIIRPLFDDLRIDGYVRKARRDAQDLKAALENIKRNKTHYPRELRQPKQENLHAFTDYDKTVIRLLAEGHAQKDIPNYLNAHKILPSGLSSVEKRLNLIKISMGFSKNEQLVAYCKEMGLI